ncbi:hypothetical protein [Paraburkholderia tropica]|nr:hypothetical protein [Paraburkholderia tropica]MBB2980546.1 hypothetical protein [Paraburkholderia tropica]
MTAPVTSRRAFARRPFLVSNVHSRACRLGSRIGVGVTSIR